MIDNPGKEKNSGYFTKVFPSFFTLLLLIFSISIFLWAEQINRFFSNVVRIQHDRGHEVIQTGPYKYIRHPGYIGGILLVIRTFLEDITLQKELPGYVEYAKKVRYRLLPGVW